MRAARIKLGFAFGERPLCGHHVAEGIVLRDVVWVRRFSHVVDGS